MVEYVKECQSLYNRFGFGPFAAQCQLIDDLMPVLLGITGRNAYRLGFQELILIREKASQLESDKVMKGGCCSNVGGIESSK
jgi:hypothetical protein